MADTSLIFNLIAQDRVSGVVRRVRGALDSAGKTAGKLAVGLSAGIAPASALAGTMLATAGSVASAGLAVAAFQASAQPQLNAVTDAAELYAKAQEAAKKGGEEAAAAQQAYTDALAEMTPATRDTAEAFIGLKEDTTAWSDSLSSSTMPIFTRGIELLRDLLPSVTPFVHAAAGALDNLLGKVERGSKSGGFQEWVTDMSTAAGPALESLGTTIGNFVVGLGALLQAFLPANSGLGTFTDGLEDGSAAFREWATNLKGSEGFAEFTENARTGGEALGNIVSAALNVAAAMAPLLGTTVLLANSFALIVSSIPTPVLTALGFIIAGLVVAMRAWALAQMVVTLHNAIWTTSQWSLNAALLANPMTWIVLGIIALIAVIVVIATKTTWFQTAWSAAWGAIKGAFSWAFNFIKNNWPLILAILTGPIGLAVLFITRKWDSIVDFVSGLPDRIGSAASGMWDGIKDSFRGALNYVIGGWNGLSFTLPSVDTHIPGIGTVGGWTLDTPNITPLASGGIVRARPGGTLALIGEGGQDEAVVPLPRGGGFGGGVQRHEFYFHFDGPEELVRLFRKAIRVRGGDVQVVLGTGG